MTFGRLTELDQQSAKAFFLVRRKGDDASQVIIVVGDLLLAEEAQSMIEGRSGFRQNVEEKSASIEKYVFVVYEELAEKTEVLAV